MKTRFIFRAPRSAIFLFLCALLQVAATWALPAQKSVGTAEPRTIVGIVLDVSGSSVVGARVTVKRVDETVVAETQADKAGSFRFDKIEPGIYHLRIDAAGFRTTQTEVKVGGKPPAPLRITLAIASHNEVVNVGVDDSAPQVTPEAAENQNANVIDRDALDRVPVFDQNYVATMSRFLDDNATGTNGVSLIVNGVEANGPGVSPSGVQEVKINQNPYSARFARPGRARLEITTKGGTPAFHGTTNFIFRDSMFDASNAFATVKPPEQRRFYEGSLTGPLGRNKQNTFLLTMERDEDNLQAVVDAQGVNGPIRENVPAPTRHFFTSFRVFHDFANGDQFWIGYSYEGQTLKNQNVGGLVLPQAGYTDESTEHEINVSYRHIFSAKWVNQLRFLVGHNDEPRTSISSAPQIVVEGLFTSGGAQADSKRTEAHFDGTDFMSYVSGKHQLVFGIDVPDISRRGADDFTNRSGVYTFSSLADYNAGIPASLLLQTGQGHLVFWERVVAAFVEDTIRLKPNFSLVVGARYYWQNYFFDQASHLAPRLGFAYAPAAKSKWVFRGGAGLFFDRSGPRPIADLLHYNGIDLLRFVATQSAQPPYAISFPITPAQLAALPVSTVTLDPQARLPRTLQYSFGIERQVTAKSTFSASYVGSRGMDLFRSRDVNAPSPPDYLARPNPELGQVRQIESEGYQKSNALELTFRGKPGKYFSGQAQYTLSKTYNNTSGILYFPANSYFPNEDWARSDNDRRHKFDLLGSAELPASFSFGVALSAYSGKPVNVTTGLDTYGDALFKARPLLPDGAMLPRNTLHGPGFLNLDVNLERDFRLSKGKKEGPTITVSLNAFNVLNHVNDVTYIAISPVPLNTGYAVQALDPRRIQLNLQFKF
jgi:hypothetical protein